MNKNEIIERIEKIKHGLFMLDMIDYQTYDEKEKVKQLYNEMKELEKQL